MSRYGDNQDSRGERPRKELNDYGGSFLGMGQQVYPGHPNSKQSPKFDDGLEMARTQQAKDVDHGQDNADNDEAEMKKEKKPSVSYYKLYSFSDPFDWLLILLGTVGACAHGAAIPVFFIFFGKLIDAFGVNYNRPDLMAEQVRKVHFRS